MRQKMDLLRLYSAIKVGFSWVENGSAYRIARKHLEEWLTTNRRGVQGHRMGVSP